MEKNSFVFTLHTEKNIIHSIFSGGYDDGIGSGAGAFIFSLIAKELKYSVVWHVRTHSICTRGLVYLRFFCSS